MIRTLSKGALPLELSGGGAELSRRASKKDR
jgi:hypothetical protein